MKGILGRKIGMTSVFSDNGKNIPVSVIEVQPNVVTAVLTKEKNGYSAIQLSAFDRREKTTKKPVLGHLKKANTGGKYFTKEIRSMEGFKLGDKLTVSQFKAGELIDVTGTSKGKGFQGNIKRHNQKIGPKSHGGGGGSQPLRQTGSLGDMVSNRVFKGMTMPGHMGNEKVTVQNIEIISIDEKQNLILVKGSIPGPKKGFLIIKNAVKGLSNKEPIVLANFKEEEIKNHLIKEAKSYGASINADMSIDEMQKVVDAAYKAKDEEKVSKKSESKNENNDLKKSENGDK